MGRRIALGQGSRKSPYPISIWFLPKAEAQELQAQAAMRRNASNTQTIPTTVRQTGGLGIDMLRLQYLLSLTYLDLRRDSQALGN